MEFEDFDVIEFLESRDINYKTSGSNVTEGWVEFNCPFCSEDPSEHFGVNLDSGLGHCWICGEKSNPIKLIRTIDDCSWLQAEKVIAEFENVTIKPKAQKKKVVNTKIEWPKYVQDKIPGLHKKYMKNRNFDVDHLTELYDLKFTTNLGDWKFRIIIPIKFENRIVTFTSRDVTNRSEVKYKHLSDQKAIIPIKNTFYNYDTIQDSAILVEGITDVWRLGNGAIGSFGTELSKPQIALLTRLKNLFIMFDSDATKKAEKLGENLETGSLHVEIIEMEEGDPAELSIDDVRHLKKELNLF